MGAVFAVQVRTGFETKAKEMLKHVFLNAGETLVKGIYALETHTEIINKDTEEIETEARINEEDIATHLAKERYRSAITNRRMQLQAIERYNSPEYEETKKAYKAEINQLEKQVAKLRNTSKKIHSVLKGYLLIELKWDSEYLPNHLWHLIKSVPLVQNILSTTPIPQEEMEQFISNMEDILEPEVVVTFEKEKEVEEVKEITSELLYEANKESTTKEEQEQIFEQIDNLNLSVVEKAKQIIKDQPVNTLIKKIKAFVKRKREMVSMPLTLLEKIYTNKELKFIGNLVNGKDFLYRLENLANQKVVLE